MCKELDKKYEEDYERFLYDRKMEVLKMLKQVEKSVKQEYKFMLNNDLKSAHQEMINRELLEYDIIEKYVK